MDQNVIDIDDEEFMGYLNLSKAVVSNIVEKEDRRLCAQWITYLCSIKDARMKKKRNEFFKYILSMLKDRNIPECLKKIPNNGTLPQVDMSRVEIPRKGELLQWLDREVLQASTSRFVSNWSADKRTYVAICPLDGKGALIYMAVAKDPSLGWDYPGLQKH